MKNNADINNVNEHGETALFFIANFGGKYGGHVGLSD